MKHIFIFNGSSETGKSILGRLLKEDCEVYDDFVIDWESPKKLAMEIAKSDKKYFAIITNNFIYYTDRELKTYYNSDLLCTRLKVAVDDCLITVCSFERN